MARLCSKHIYQSPDIIYLKNTNIIEYDMKDAGLSIIKEFKLLDTVTINYLDNLNKTDKLVAIGRKYIGNKTFSKKHVIGFSKARCLFVDNNSIKDYEILSIKKDAIFVINKVADDLKIGKNILFVSKHIYTSYMKLFNLEIYYNSVDDTIDIKGIGNNIYLHKNSFIELIKDFMRMKENNNGSINHMYDIFKHIVVKYKSMRYTVSYYREFNNLSLYKLNIGNSYYIKDIGDKNIIDISYNLRLLFEIMRIML